MSRPPSPAPPPDATWMFLVRHGATPNNEAHPPRIQGRRADPPLSAAGQAQARAAAAALAGVRLAAVYSSTLARARETATAIAAPHGLDVETIDALVECDVGQWEGRTWEDVAASEPAEYAAFRRDPARNPYRGGENLEQVLDRVAPTFRALAADRPGQSLAVVAHNIVNRVWLAELLEIPLARARDVVVQHNGGISLVEWRGKRGKVLMLNASFHLAEWR